MNNQGLPWWSSGWDSVLPMQGAWVRSLVRELRSTCPSQDPAQPKRKTENEQPKLPLTPSPNPPATCPYKGSSISLWKQLQETGETGHAGKSPDSVTVYSGVGAGGGRSVTFCFLSLSGGEGVWHFCFPSLSLGDFCCLSCVLLGLRLTKDHLLFGYEKQMLEWDPPP